MVIKSIIAEITLSEYELATEILDLDNERLAGFFNTMALLASVLDKGAVDDQLQAAAPYIEPEGKAFLRKLGQYGE